jgi:exodeoxyribonuclease VIII
MSIYIPGIYQISNEDYHAAPGLSRSGIMHMKKSPAHYLANKRADDIEHETPEALLMGSALDTYVLDNENFRRLYIRADKPHQGSQKGKDEWEAIRFEAGKRTILSSPQYGLIELMGRAVRADATAQKILANNKIQQAIFFKDKDSGCLLKSCPDIIKPKCFADLKTSVDASDKSFSQAIAKYGYHIQAAMAIDGWEQITGERLNDFLFLIVEKKAPFGVAVKKLHQDAIEVGRQEYKFYARKYMECETQKTWPGYETSIVSLPAYYQ